MWLFLRKRPELKLTGTYHGATFYCSQENSSLPRHHVEGVGRGAVEHAEAAEVVGSRYE